MCKSPLKIKKLLEDEKRGDKAKDRGKGVNWPCLGDRCANRGVCRLVATPQIDFAHFIYSTAYSVMLGVVIYLLYNR